jgi:biofilm PGA synthesis N-glycosyltransferase PgaC
LPLLDLFAVIDHSRLYRVLLYFYGGYPVFMAVVWVLLSLFFVRRQESRALKEPDGKWPFVSILVPAYAEEQMIARTLEAILRLDYPRFEAIVIDDGSADATAEIARRYLGRGPIRLLEKPVNEGKAMALNDALPLCRGEILVLIDADTVVQPQLLKVIVPHYLNSTRVGGVTGNPRVANRRTLLQRMQALEFCSIISMQRRAQRIWGRVLTVSGAVCSFRRTAVLEAGGFSPDMATEDIDMTWRIQMRHWDVRYEPRAVAWIQAPPTLPELWKQRRRWARGLAQVLRRHRRVALSWSLRRLWAVWYEAIVSVAWAHVFILITAYWIVSRLAGYVPYGASPIPNLWGMIMATSCLVQLWAGALSDRRYEPEIIRILPESVFYPFIYWILTSLITCIYTLPALARRPSEVQRWKIRRTAP